MRLRSASSLQRCIKILLESITSNPDRCSYKANQALKELGSAFPKCFRCVLAKGCQSARIQTQRWPSFRASHLRTVGNSAGFPVDSLRRIADASNAVVRASVTHPTHPDIELSTFNPLSTPKEIGAVFCFWSKLRKRFNLIHKTLTQKAAKYDLN